MSYSRRQLEAFGEPFGDSATQVVGGKRIYGGGGSGGGGGPTTSTVTQTNVPDWLRPQVESVLGGATKELFNTTPNSDGTFSVTGTRPFQPYSQNASDYIAPFSPLQQQAMQGAANLQMPGQFQSGTDLTAMGGLGGLGVAQQAMGAGNAYAQQATNPGSIQAYMSPYMQNVVQQQQQDLQRQADIARQSIGAGFASKGAFGGGRFAVQQGMAAADLARQKAGVQATGLQNAFADAQKAQQFGADLGLRGLNQATSAFNMAGQMGGQLGQLGAQQLAAQQGIIGTQAGQGAQQQQQQQNIINQAIQTYAQSQQAPLERLQQYNALLRGYALPGTTATTYQATPPVAGQLAGLGTAAYGASRMFKSGGKVIDNLSDLALNRVLEGS
jgi:hypothetical protein